MSLMGHQRTKFDVRLVSALPLTATINRTLSRTEVTAL
jgi:hypothetical protein